MKVRLTFKGAAMLAAVAGAAISIAAHAQSRGVLLDEQGNRVREAPSANETYSQTISQSKSESTLNDGKNVVKAVVENGVATITLNGETVATKQMSEAWDRYDVTGPDGSIIATVTRHGDHVGISSDGSPALAELYTAVAPRPTWGGGFGATVAGEAPVKVMMGITMGSPSEETAEQLGIKPEETTLVTSVRDGLPAAAAGLKAFDVIVSVDGQKPASQEAIRKVLRDKSAGDEIKFEVLRRGQKQDVAVKLEAYDPEKLGVSGFALTMPPGGQGGTLDVRPFIELQNAWSAHSEELQEQMSELASQMSELSSEMQTAAGKEAQELSAQLADLGSRLAKIGEELAAEMEASSAKIASNSMNGIIQLRGRLGNQIGSMLMTPPLTPTAPVAPGMAAAPSAREAELHAQMQALRAENDALRAERDAQSKATEERLRRLEELMEKAAKEKSGG